MFTPDDPTSAEQITPMPEVPPLRTFVIRVYDADPDNTQPIAHTVVGHSIDFTTAGGIFITRAVPLYLTAGDEQGWVVVKRYVRGFAGYGDFEEVFTPPSALTLH